MPLWHGTESKQGKGHFPVVDTFVPHQKGGKTLKVYSKWHLNVCGTFENSLMISPNKKVIIYLEIPWWMDIVTNLQRILIPLPRQLLQYLIRKAFGVISGSICPRSIIWLQRRARCRKLFWVFFLQLFEQVGSRRKGLDTWWGGGGLELWIGMLGEERKSQRYTLPCWIEA